MRDWNKAVAALVKISNRYLELTYEGLKFWLNIISNSIKNHLELTYEGLKCCFCLCSYRSAKGFRAYLWGIEICLNSCICSLCQVHLELTYEGLKWNSNRRTSSRYKPFRAYLWGIEIILYVLMMNLVTVI